MDNNNKQDPNMKSNWQTITMLVVAAILTFIVVSSMNNYLNSGYWIITWLPTVRRATAAPSFWSC